MEIDIVFVFIGDKLPSYAYYNINKTVKRYKSVKLLTNAKKGLSKIPSELIVSLKSLFIQSEKTFFESSKNNFRDGFWNKTITRYYVLKNYMERFKLNKLIHVELDNYLSFDLKTIENLAHKKQYLIMYPVIKDKYAGGSFIFINDYQGINSLCQFIDHQRNVDDMQLLHEFYFQNQNSTLALPVDVRNPLVDEIGLFDIAGYGQYLFGIDPENTISPIYNLYINEKEIQLKFHENKYIFKEQNFYLSAFNETKIIRLNNIHVHSKVFKKMINNNYIEKVLQNVNKGIRTKIYPRFYKNDAKTIINYISTKIMGINLFRDKV